MYEIVMTDDARRAYQRADAALARKLNRAFENLARDPHVHPNIKRLTGALLGR